MTYAPPSGWIERTDEPTDERTRVTARFHSRNDCGRIKNPRALVLVDKPYHAPRCPGCAPEYPPAITTLAPMPHIGLTLDAPNSPASRSNQGLHGSALAAEVVRNGCPSDSDADAHQSRCRGNRYLMRRTRAPSPA
jgi:hypothetical protein